MKSYGDGGSDGCTTVWMYLMPLSCILKMVTKVLMLRGSYHNFFKNVKIALQTLYDYIYMKFQKRQNQSIVKKDQWLRATAVWLGQTAGGMRELFLQKEMFDVLIVLVITQEYTFARTHLTEHFKWVQFIIYKLYLKKVMKTFMIL